MNNSKSFGRRLLLDAPRLPLESVRLHAVYAALKSLFGEGVAPPFSLTQDGSVLMLDEHTTVRIDSASGHFVYADRNALTALVLRTPSYFELMLAIVAHQTRRKGLKAADDLVLPIEQCVGRSVKDVERALVLATFQRCGGNRVHAAEMLGISLLTLRKKLQDYWHSDFTTVDSHAGRTAEGWQDNHEDAPATEPGQSG